MKWLPLFGLIAACSSPGLYTHVIETTGLPTGRTECMAARVTLVGPDGVAWRSVGVSNFELIPAYDCALGGGGEQEDSPGGME